MSHRSDSDPLAAFHPSVREWFTSAFEEPTRAQALGWGAIARGESSLILAPTGSGKTLAAFLWCLDRLMFSPPPPKERRCRVLYVSPLKALAVDVERNLRAPLAAIARVADRRGEPYVAPAIAVRTGDTPAAERRRFQREPADILITTPESLYLLLTSNAREALRSVTTIIIDEIHALVPTKRGAHLAVSIERLVRRAEHPPQRIGLSATQRPLEEVARFLGGVESAISGRQLTRRGRQPASRGQSAARGRGPAAVSRPRAPDTIAQEIDDQFGIHRGIVPYRPITIIDAGSKKALSLRIELPSQGSVGSEGSQGSGSQGSQGNPVNPSIWSALHPRLLELIRAHRTTLIFVNSRRLAERLAGALNELAGETLVRSHHGSIAPAQRTEIEDRLKAGALRALVATSSLELGIDMGAIDLVVQIEAPPSVASGLQRIGRSGHRIDEVSEGVIFPKFRGDLVASAALSKAMREGEVEASRCPRNPLDIAAQQIVAMTAMDQWDVDALFATLRSAAPFAELGRGAFEGVLDMLSGRYPSDEFAELRPRITWDRARGTVVAREGARRVAIANGGTIPDRGLYGVYLAGAGPGAARVGELDEEMVFESRVGEVFVLGASSWRIADITHDRVLVSPAPGEPGKMPFWRGDRAGRPLELGLAIGRLVHDLLRLPRPAAVDRLTSEHDLDARAADELLQYLFDQRAAAQTVPDASTVVVERVRDDLGDWRVAVLSPRGGRIHAPWAMAAAAKIREAIGIDVETLWGDDGFVVRFPDVDRLPDERLLLPDPDEAHALVVRQLGGTALFAAKFRENAARSLLLPKRRPGMRAPLWQQRKRAADLLAVASRYGSFPVLLETYRECLCDFFDMPALISTLRDIRSRKVRVATVDADRPSPFAASLLFNYVASFLYDGDAPLAERRAQALSVDHAQLRELIGDAELRELLDADALETVERQLQRLEPSYRARSADGVHDMLLAIGDLAEDELLARVLNVGAAESVQHLLAANRILPVRIAGQTRFIAVEDAARYRDGLGVDLPPGVPDALLAPFADPLGDLARRYARTHAPFTVVEFATRYGLAIDEAEGVLGRLTAADALVDGEFRPGGTRREWTDPGVLGLIRRRSLARLRKDIEPTDQAVLARFATTWQGVVRRRPGPDALLDIIEQLQGASIPMSILETEILPARIEQYDPADLDAVTAAGEIVWVGVEPIGERDGRIALYLADQLARLLPPETDRAVRSVRLQPDRDRAVRSVRPQSDRETAILDYLQSRGASFFGPLHEAVGGGYPPETVKALWTLVWRGLVTNDTFRALRAFSAIRAPQSPRRSEPRAFRSRRLVPPTAEGRWTLVARPVHGGSRSEATAWAAAITNQLLTRHGVLTREAVAAESIPGGFGAIYPVLKAMEEAGRIRRGYFVAGLGATQFALPGALDLLRSFRATPGVDGLETEALALSATDPANPYGAALKWPAVGLASTSAPGPTHAPQGAVVALPSPVLSSDEASSALRRPSRSVGATVVLVAGALVAYLARGDRVLLTWLPEAEPSRSRSARAVARLLIERARGGPESPRGMLIEEIDGVRPDRHPMAPLLVEAGFLPGAMGFQAKLRGSTPSVNGKQSTADS